MITIKNTPNLTEKFTDNLTETQWKIIRAIEEDSKITQQKLSEIIGISRRSIAENISKLKDKGILKRVGTDRKGYWEIIN